MEDKENILSNASVLTNELSSEEESLSSPTSTSAGKVDKNRNDCISGKQDINSMARSQFLKYQKKLLYLERDAELKRESMKQTVETGAGRPGLLSHLEVVHTATRIGKMCVTFTSFADSNLPPHGLRKGDNVCVFSGGAMCREEDHCTDGVVLEVSAHEVVITLDDNAFQFDDDSSYSLKHHPSLENTRRIIRGLTDMEDVKGSASHLVEVLFREQPPLPPLPQLPPQLCTHDTNTLNLFNKDLDASQQEAVEFVMKQQDLAVVHGPPGTGKTTTLIEIIRQHVKMRVKVLALAPSNLGVDNLVERLDGVGIRVVRVGHPARTTPATERHTIDALLHNSEDSQVIQDIHQEIQGLWSSINGCRHKDRRGVYKEIGTLRKEVNRRTDRLTRQLMRGADVVLCTLLSAHSRGALRHVQENHFGLTIIDECSQGTEASCYLGLMRSPKLVLAGDHKQLPPTVINPEASDLLTSLMERVTATYTGTVVRMLTVQYRMNTNIMNWSSSAMYDNKLEAHPSVADHLLYHFPHVTDTNETKVPLLLIDTSNCPGFEESETVSDTAAPVSKENEGEAALVLCLVKRLIEAGTGQDQVAVITPYSRQVKLVRSLVNVDYPDVEVQTVDGFQGREKDSVILTLVRSNNKGEIGFLAEDRRLNVAVTRARRQLSVVCNSNTLQQNNFLKTFVCYMMEHARVVRADQMDQDRYIKISADFSKVDLSAVLKRTVEEAPPKLKTEEEIENEEQQRREQKIERYTKTLKKFQVSSNCKHQFPSKLSSFDRMLVHDIADSLGLYHYSEGLLEKRHVVVAKEQKKEKVVSKDEEQSEDDVPQPKNGSNNKQKQSDNASIENQNNIKKSASVAASTAAASSVSTKHCTLCGKNILIANFTTHRIGCERKEREAIALQKKKMEEKRLEAERQSKEERVKASKKKSAKEGSINGTNGDAAALGSHVAAKGTKNKKGKKGSVPVDEEEDFDAVLSSFNNTKCGLKGCGSGGGGLMLQSCRWCHTAYCLQHFVAEAHGCGHHAKADARATVLREGVVYPGSGVPSKLPSHDRRAQLHRKLDAKFNAMEKARKKQDKK